MIQKRMESNQNRKRNSCCPQSFVTDLPPIKWHLVLPIFN